MANSNCTACNIELEIPDEYFGKEVVCPSCNSSFFASSNSNVDQYMSADSHAASQWPNTPASHHDDHVACPACAEKILKAAKKCRYCGTDLIRPTAAGDIKAKNHPSYGAYTLICILIPIVGLLIGIVQITKSDPLDKKLGEHAIAFSLFMAIVYAILAGVMMAGLV